MQIEELHQVGILGCQQARDHVHANPKYSCNLGCARQKAFERATDQHASLKKRNPQYTVTGYIYL